MSKELEIVVDLYYNNAKGAWMLGKPLGQMTQKELLSVIFMQNKQQLRMIEQHKKEINELKNKYHELQV